MNNGSVEKKGNMYKEMQSGLGLSDFGMIELLW